MPKPCDNAPGCIDCGKCGPQEPVDLPECCTTCPSRVPNIKREEPLIAPWPECKRFCDSYRDYMSDLVMEAVADLAHAYLQVERERDALNKMIRDATHEVDTTGLPEAIRDRIVLQEAADAAQSIIIERDKALEALKAIRGYTHEHDQQPDHIAWHRLKVDIPSIIDGVLGPDPEEPVSEFVPEVANP
jgi:hypothetical protein